MNITVFGANGNIGTRVVKQLLEKGCFVKAFIHGDNPFDQHANLTIINGSIYNSQQVASAINGSSVVISTLGSWGTPKKDILSSAMHSIIPAMQSQKISRIITLTGADADTSYDKKTLFHSLMRAPIMIAGKKIMQDSESHIAQLEAGNLDWTIIRSPIMNNKGVKSYELTPRRSFVWQTINRDAVANAIVEQVVSKEFIKQAPFIWRSK